MNYILNIVRPTRLCFSNLLSLLFFGCLVEELNKVNYTTLIFVCSRVLLAWNSEVPINMTKGKYAGYFKY